MFNIFRSLPKPGQVVRIRLDIKPGLFDHHRTAVYFVTKLKCKDASGKIKTIGLAFNKNEYEDYVKRGAKMFNDGKLTQPFEFGKYYGARGFSRGGCVSGRYSKLVIMRLYSYKTRNKLDDLFLAVNESQFDEAVARYKSRRDFNNLYNPLMRLFANLKRLFRKS